ncbi:hypothetical protein Dsin_020529 [Dipteronia sinensis]|uniref:Uncharacterized protein n=1 Tax=Dipteronia sinensis TaxID=43782 RepID=A0AAE0AAI7_9ROSI|nr:hypothetical protein Dsin_020529 [Dipteronia sinensis]
MLQMINKAKDTTLHEAVRYNHLDVVKVLTVENRELLYDANNAGETPLYLAEERGYVEVLKEILSTCISPVDHGPNSRTALHTTSGSRKGSNVNGKVNSVKKGHQRRQTLVDVVNGHYDRSKDESLKVLEKGISMSWDTKDKEDSWLSRCTIGDLKFFSNVTKVLWGSLTMLELWFLHEVGLAAWRTSSCGKGHLERRWLDKGRLLVLVPQEWQCPFKIKEVMGGKCFGVKVSEESTSVDSLWLERFLGMMSVNSRSGMVSSPVVVNSRIGDRVTNPLSDVEHGEEVKKRTSDGDEAIQKNKMYHAFGPISNVKAMVSDNPILSKREKTAIHRGSVVIRKRCGSRGFKMKDGDLSFLGSEFFKDQVNDLSVGLNSNFQFLRVAGFISDKSNEGDMGQEVVSKCFKKKISSEEKLKDEMVVGPLSEISIGIKGCDPVCDKDVWSRPPCPFQDDSNEVILGLECDLECGTRCVNLARNDGFVVRELSEISLNVPKK